MNLSLIEQSLAAISILRANLGKQTLRPSASRIVSETVCALLEAKKQAEAAHNQHDKGDTA